MRAAELDILIVPGLGGSGPNHWQSRWERRLKTARRVEQDDWDRPDRTGWRDRIVAAVDAAERPAVLVAHSLGVVSAVDAAPLGPRGRVLGALLVAPPDTEANATALPELRPFAPLPRQRLPFPAFLVASRNDPYASFQASEALAADWGALLLDAGHSGHINSDSGHGPWPEGLLLFARLLAAIEG